MADQVYFDKSFTLQLPIAAKLQSVSGGFDWDHFLFDPENPVHAFDCEETIDYAISPWFNLDSVPLPLCFKEFLQGIKRQIYGGSCQSIICAHNSRENKNRRRMRAGSDTRALAPFRGEVDVDFPPSTLDKLSNTSDSFAVERPSKTSDWTPDSLRFAPTMPEKYVDVALEEDMLSESMASIKLGASFDFSIKPL